MHRKGKAVGASAKAEIAVVCALLLLNAGAAHAQSAGSLVLGTGWMNIAPQDSAGPLRKTLTVGEKAIPLPDDQTISSGVKATNTLGLTATYFITDNIATELAVGIPPRFTIQGAGSAEKYGNIGSARMWSPALLVKYYFGKANAAFRPFVGIGASYIWFTGSKVTNDDFQNDVAGGKTNVSISKGLSPVFNAGASYEFAKNWYAGLSVSFIPMTRTVTMTTPAVGGSELLSAKGEARMRLNPIVTYLNIGYRF